MSEATCTALGFVELFDQLEVRLRNYAETDPSSGNPFSSKSLRECYRVGAERFGWSARPGKPTRRFRPQ